MFSTLLPFLLYLFLPFLETTCNLLETPVLKTGLNYCHATIEDNSFLGELFL